MTAFLIILVVPVLGGLLFVSEHYRRNADTPGGRFFARGCVLAFGVLVGLIGTGLLVVTAAWIATGKLDRSVFLAILTFVTQVTAGLLMLWTARCAVRVFSLPPLSRDPDSAAELHQERASEELRLSSAALVLVPVLLLGVFGVVLAVPVLLWGVAFWTSRQSRETQFLWTMALAVRQQLPLAEEVDAFAVPLWPRRKRAYYSLSSRLRDGRSLGEALEMSSGILPRALSSEIRIAEEAGTLPTVLSEMATRATSSLTRSRFDSSLAITLVYGWVLLATILTVVGYVMYWIVPKFKAIFNDFGVELPAMTISVIHAADAFTENFLIVMPVFGLVVLAALLGAIVHFVGWSNVNVPLLMRWFPRRDAPPLLRALSHAVGASQPLPEIVSEMSQRHLREDMRARLARISVSLAGGAPVWEPLRNEGFIRPREAEALAASQRANNLPWAMRTLADSMDRTSRHRALFWLEILKPSLVVGIGLVVGWYVIAMFLPLVKLITGLA